MGFNSVCKGLTSTLRAGWPRNRSLIADRRMWFVCFRLRPDGSRTYPRYWHWRCFRAAAKRETDRWPLPTGKAMITSFTFTPLYVFVAWRLSPVSCFDSYIIFFSFTALPAPDFQKFREGITQWSTWCCSGFTLNGSSSSSQWIETDGAIAGLVMAAKRRNCFPLFCHHFWAFSVRFCVL